jgi:hypothetical protein
MKKGMTNNPNGRPKGKPNKTTTEMREFLQAFVENNLDDLQQEFDALEGADKFRALEKLLPYILPKHNAVSITRDEPETTKRRPAWMSEGDDERKEIDLSKVPTEILEALLDSQKEDNVKRY